MAKAGILGVHVVDTGGNPVRAGVLTRDAVGATAFVVDEAYLRSPAQDRPILSLTWFNPIDEDDTRARLAARSDKISLHGNLPPWFSNLLPEGALRQLVETEMGRGEHDEFDVIARLGADLPGAILVVPETGIEADSGGFRWENLKGFRVPVPEGTVKFSLAGIQLKFTAELRGERLTAPARSGAGRFILKVPSDRHQRLPETEYTAMMLCAAAGIETAACRLVPTASVEGIPEELLANGEFALLVERFDREPDGRRCHIEDMAQVLGASPFQKYVKGNGETVLSTIARFSADRRHDVLEGMRRIAADILVGNGDNHLKNWSFLFPDAVSARLAPAYDVVPTWLYGGDETLGLPFVGTATARLVGFCKFRRVAKHLRLDPEGVDRDLRRFVEACLDIWPRRIRDLPIDRTDADRLMARMRQTRLATEVLEGNTV